MIVPASPGGEAGYVGLEGCICPCRRENQVYQGNKREDVVLSDDAHSTLSGVRGGNDMWACLKRYAVAEQAVETLVALIRTSLALPRQPTPAMKT